MTWGDTFNRHKATGMDPSDAAFRADQSDPMRKRRAEVENERLREALIQADLKIRSLPGTDQSDVEFIREALGNNTPSSNVDAFPKRPADEWSITQAQLHSACLSYRHDFGLLSESEQYAVMFAAREWLTAWRKALATAAEGK